MQNKYKEYIMQIYNCLKDALYTKNAPFSVIRLVFIKYAIDNNLGISEHSDEYEKVRKIISEGDIEANPNLLIPVLSLLDSAYNLKGLLIKSILCYTEDLFGIGNNYTKSAISKGHYKKLMNKLSETDFRNNTNKNETFAVGKEIVACLLSLIYGLTNSYAKQTGEYTTNPTVANLASKILNVKNGETFCDFASGMGVSTIKIVADAVAKIYNVETSTEIATIAAMLYIMAGFKNFEISISKNMTADYHFGKADKIFTDAPLIMTQETEQNEKVNLLERTLRNLNKEGIAVLTVPSSFLIRASNAIISQRKYLFDERLINSVISLPPCWFGSNMNTNLIVLTKASNENILFIDASSNNYFKFFKKDKNNYNLTEEGVSFISEIFNKRTETAGISKLVNTLNENFSLLPSIYIEAAPIANKKIKSINK